MKNIRRSRDAKRGILIVDDHPLLREGLRKVIDLQHDLVVCGEAGNAPGGLAAVEKYKPDAVIVDITLEEGSGLELIKNIHAACPKLPVLALSMHHEDLYADRALRAGASGYVMKREPASVIMDALRKVLAGQIAVSEHMVSRLVGRRVHGDEASRKSPAELLSDREIEIYRCLGSGQGTREIAGKLRIAISTVESYRASIKEKLGLKNGTSLVSSAARFVAEAGE